MYSYSKLGNCEVGDSKGVTFPSNQIYALTSNRKFLPLLDPVYSIPYTSTNRYPGTTWNFIHSIKSLENPRNLKTYSFKQKKVEKKSCNSCGQVY